jgi:hypothetical protein
MHDGSIGVAGEVKVAGDSVYFEVPLDPTALLLVDILYDSVELLVLVHVLISVYIALRKDCLLKRVLHVDLVNLQNVLDIQRQEGAGVPRELNVDVHL